MHKNSLIKSGIGIYYYDKEDIYRRADNYNPKEFRTRTQTEIIPHGRKVYVLGNNNFKYNEN